MIRRPPRSTLHRSSAASDVYKRQEEIDKEDATSRYYTSHTRTMLPTRKSAPGSSRHWTTWRHPDDCKETQTAVVWSCLPLIRSVQNHLARHSERGKKEEVGRQHQGIDRPGVRQVPEGSGEQGKMEKTGCKIICGAPTTLAVKGLMMMMMMNIVVMFLVSLSVIQCRWTACFNEEKVTI